MCGVWNYIDVKHESSQLQREDDVVLMNDNVNLTA